MIELREITAHQAGIDADDRTCRCQNIELLAPEPIVEYLQQLYQFGHDAFDGCVFFKSSRKHIRVATLPMAIPPGPDIDRVGLELLRIDMATPRISTVAAMTWGRRAGRNAVDTSQQQCLAYLRRNPIALTDRQLSGCTGRGFVIIRHETHPLGVGFLESTRPEDDHCGQMRSMYPSAFSAELQETSPFGNPR